MLKHYVIEDLNYLERIQTWVQNPDNHSTLVLSTKPPVTEWILVVNDASGMIKFSELAEQELAGLIREVDRPE